MSDKLPFDFNPEEYLILNQDVRKAGVNALTHYLNFGIKEGREYTISEKVKALVMRRVCAKKEKVSLQVACIMMQKNEGALLSAWIEHHAKIFGISNLWIYDNGSDDSLTIGILSHYEHFGVNIIYDKKNNIDFENKGNLVLQLIQFMDLFSIYDFFFPLDCDEFLGVRTSEKNFSVDPGSINKELDKYLKCTQILTIEGALVNQPESKNHFVFDEHKKCFFAMKTAESLDLGFHIGKSKYGGVETKTKIIYIHLHNKPFEKLIYSAREKLKFRVNVDDNVSLKNYSGPGHHLCSYFYMSEEDYKSKYSNRNLIKFNDLFYSLKKMGIDWPYENSRTSSPAHDSGHSMSYLTFPPNLNNFFAKVVSESTAILEYGSGGSTKFISQSSRYLLSIDSDKKFIDSLKNQIDDINCNHNISLLHIDIGPTKEWGHPADISKKGSWYTYAISPWKVLIDQSIAPDLVLIDGRFRVACMLATMASASKPTRIIFDDYVGRSYKETIEKFIKPLNIIDRAAYFEINPGDLSASDILSSFNSFFDPS